MPVEAGKWSAFHKLPWLYRSICNLLSTSLLVCSSHHWTTQIHRHHLVPGQVCFVNCFAFVVRFFSRNVPHKILSIFLRPLSQNLWTESFVWRMREWENEFASQVSHSQTLPHSLLLFPAWFPSSFSCLKYYRNCYRILDPIRVPRRSSLQKSFKALKLHIRQHHQATHPLQTAGLINRHIRASQHLHM